MAGAEALRAATPSARAQAALSQAVGLLQQRRFAEAAGLLRQVTAAEPGVAEAHRLHGLALLRTGQGAAGEAALGRAVRLAPRSAAALASLAEALMQRGDAAGAETRFRAALAADRRWRPAAVGLNRLLLALGRAEEAARATAALAAAPDADAGLLQDHAAALKAAGRVEDAVSFNRRAAAAAPASPHAWHNLAAALGDLGEPAEALQAAERALAGGLDAPETHLVRARALQALDRVEAAEAGFRAAVARRPDFPDAQDELAQLIWMRTADADAALAPVEAALRQAPGATGLILCKLKLLKAAGREAEALEAAERAARAPDAEPALHLAAAQAAVGLAPDRAVAHAERALALAPEERLIRGALAEACLAVGDAPRAEATAAALHRERPEDQHALALWATALRLLGDARYGELYDYDSFVRAYTLEPPAGWSGLADFLADLAAALERMHGLKTHPVGQSLRHGTQTNQDLRRSPEPAIQGLQQALAAPIRQHIAALGKGRDSLRRRARGTDYSLSGLWSVRLKASGFHVDHIHPLGWLSSAFYVAVPKAAGDEAQRPGWIKFGQPGVPTRPALAAERFVRPEPGRLVLFPSYMWHGTVPFSGDEARLTCAFDAVPA